MNFLEIYIIKELDYLWTFMLRAQVPMSFKILEINYPDKVGFRYEYEKEEFKFL